MKTFPTKVERWRYKVGVAITAVVASVPGYYSLVDRFKAIVPNWSDLFLAIIQQESGGDPDLYGDSEHPEIHTDDSIGLMQLNYEAGTPQGLGYRGTPVGLLDPGTNLFFGIKYFLKQLDRYEDIDKAILAYNAGSYHLNEAGLPINLTYLESVLAFLTEKKTLLLSDLQPSDSSSSTSAQEKSKTEATPVINEPVVKLPHPFISKIYLPIFFIVSLAVSIVAFLCN